MPKWYADLHTGFNLVDTKLGAPYAASNAARKAALSPEAKSNISEYEGMLHKYFQEGLKQHGITSSSDYHHSVVQDSGASEKLRQAVSQALTADPRALELMEYFGKA